MTISQSSLFDFKPILRERPKNPVIALKDPCEPDGLMRCYRSDAESYVRCIGDFFDGKCRTDLRVLPSNYHGTIAEGSYRFRSEGEPTDGRLFDSWLQLMGYVHKDIMEDGRVEDILNLSEYDPITHKYNNAYKMVKDARIEDEKLHIITDDDMEYTMMLEADEGCDPYRAEKYDPTFKTEHFLNEAFRHGILPSELEFAYGHHAYALHCYKPFYRDHINGGFVRSEEFARIMAFADRIGIQPKVFYGPPKPLPDKWDISPIYQGKYCARSAGCERKKECGGCVACDRFLYNREPVQKAHENRPDRKKEKIKCECEDDYEEDFNEA